MKLTEVETLVPDYKIHLCHLDGRLPEAGWRYSIAAPNVNSQDGRRSYIFRSSALRAAKRHVRHLIKSRARLYLVKA